MLESKVCKGCQVDRLVASFNRHPRNRDRLQTYCRTCQQQLRRVHYIRRRAEEIKRATEYGKKHPVSSEYKTWNAMKSRCENPNVKRYKDYGGRGIKICEQWRHSFKTFLQDMGLRPLGKTLDRIDNNGNYEPENCKWSTPKEQANNRRTKQFISLK